MSAPSATIDRDQRLAEVRRHLEVVGVDVDAEHEIYHPDAVLEYRGDLVARETIYVTEHVEAPAWRAGWRAS